MDGDRLFSIVTVCLNSEKTIERAISSVLTQNQAIQYIILDGKSVDSTMNIVYQYQDRISEIISERDDGIFDAMNKAIAYCKGDIVAFLNSDDWYTENALEKVATAFRTTDADIVVGDYFRVAPGQTYDRKNQGHIGIWDIKIGIMYCHQSIFCKKSIFDEIGLFDVQYKIAADYDWLLRAVYAGKKIVHISEPLCFFSAGGVSEKNSIQRVREVYKIAKKHALGQDAELIPRIALRKEYSIKGIRLDRMIAEKKWNGVLERIKIFAGQESICLFGVSMYVDFVIDMCMSQNIAIKHIIDNDTFRRDQIYHNIKVLSPSYLRGEKRKVVITSARYIPEIKGELIEMGYKKESDFITLLDLCDI